MGDDSGILINEAVNLLTKLQEGQAVALKAKYPDLDDAFKGIRLGSKASPNDDDDLLLTRKAEFLRDLLDEVKTLCEFHLDSLAKRIHVADMIATAGEVASVVGTSSVVGCLALQRNQTAMLVGILSLIATLSAIACKHLMSSSGTSKPTARELYRDLVEANFDVRALRAELGFALEARNTVRGLAGIVRRSNESARKVYKLFGQMPSGYRVARSARLERRPEGSGIKAPATP